MREIKFRAWDIDNKCFVYLIIAHHAIGPLIAPAYKGNFDEWLQYTGLKDKNGEEIYEGDRLLKDVGKTNHAVGEFEIRWHGAGFGIFAVNKYQGWLGEDVVSNSAVIGNIYEGS